MKNLNFVQKLALIIMLLIGVSLLFLFWNKHSNSEYYRNPQVNPSSFQGNLLIAKKSSPFKDAITAEILNRYDSSSLMMKLIDVKDLENIDAENFDAILIMHRWEAGAPAESVQFFMNKNIELKNKMVILTTSWNGLEKLDNYDAITGASIIKDVPIFTEKIIKRLDKLLEDKN